MSGHSCFIMYFVYILFSEKAIRYYIGQTNNVEARLTRHNEGRETATKPYVPWTLVWFVKKETRAEAMMLEKKLKNLSPSRIKDFIQKYS